MSEQEAVIFDLDLRTEKAETSARRVTMIIYRAFGLWNRLCRILGIPPDSHIAELTRKIQHLVMLFRQLQTAATAAQLAMVPGAGPIAAAYAGISIAGAGLTAYDLMRGY